MYASVWYVSARNLIYSGYPWYRENRENGPKKFPVRENTGNLEISQNTGNFLLKHRENTGNFISSSCKCSDSKGKGYCDSCHKKKNPFFSRSWIGLPSQFCVCNTHKLCKLAQGNFAAGQGKHREFANTI